MSSRYGGPSGYDEDAVWSRRDGGAGYNMRKSPPLIYSVQPSPHTTHNPQHTSHTIVHSSIKPMPDSDIYKVGIYGWRKRCLYVFILIMTVLDFSMEGIGALKVEQDGIKVLGRSEFDKPVQFSRLSTPDGQALSIDSGSGVTINSHNFSGYSTASLNLNPDGKASAVCERFEVLDPDRKLLFFVDNQEIGLKLENLRILDDGGSIFEGAIQTAIIRPEPDSPLSLESPTRSLNIEAGQDIELLSSSGEIQLNSLLDIHLKSKQGDIRLESGFGEKYRPRPSTIPAVYMPERKTVYGS